MKLIKKLDTKKDTNGHMIKWGLFLCPYCKKEVEKRLNNGARNKSCGCMHRIFHSQSIITHGDSRGGEYHRLYRIWGGMKTRCYNPKPKDAKSYKDKGIEVCKQWKKHYIMFSIWALCNGYRNDLVIDRIDSDKGYNPDNCQWITIKENSQKTSNRKLDKTKAEIARVLRKKYNLKTHLIAWLFDISISHTTGVLNNVYWS